MHLSSDFRGEIFETINFSSSFSSAVAEVFCKLSEVFCEFSRGKKYCSINVVVVYEVLKIVGC